MFAARIFGVFQSFFTSNYESFHKVGENLLFSFKKLFTTFKWYDREYIQLEFHKIPESRFDSLPVL